MLPEMYVLKIYVHPYGAENYFIASVHHFFLMNLKPLAGQRRLNEVWLADLFFEHRRGYWIFKPHLFVT